MKEGVSILRQLEEIRPYLTVRLRRDNPSLIKSMERQDRLLEVGERLAEAVRIYIPHSSPYEDSFKREMVSALAAYQEAK